MGSGCGGVDLVQVYGVHAYFSDKNLKKFFFLISVNYLLTLFNWGKACFYFILPYFILILAHIAQHAGSLFPDQESNLFACNGKHDS